MGEMTIVILFEFFYGFLGHFLDWYISISISILPNSTNDYSLSLVSNFLSLSFFAISKYFLGLTV
jgi:hypothetical protein